MRLTEGRQSGPSSQGGSLNGVATALIWTGSLPPLSLMAVVGGCLAHCGLDNLVVLAEKKSMCLQEPIQDSDYRYDVPHTLLLLLCCCRRRRRCCHLLSACVQVLGLLWRIRQQCSWLCTGLPPVL